MLFCVWKQKSQSEIGTEKKVGQGCVEWSLAKIERKREKDRLGDRHRHTNTHAQKGPGKGRKRHTKPHMHTEAERD